MTRAIATCPTCGSTTPKGYLAQEAKAGRMGHRLYCVIYRDSWRDKNKDGTQSKRETTCRVFAKPDERHFAGDAHVAVELTKLQSQWDRDDTLPTEALPDATKPKTPSTTGCQNGAICSASGNCWPTATASKRSASALTPIKTPLG